jgi:DNA-binding XRE family transcriptional regulator
VYTLDGMAQKTRLGPHDGGSVDEWFAEEEARDPGFIAAIDAGALQLRLAAELKRLREAAGLTQEQLAERAGMKQSGVARVESGKVMPSWDMTAKFASACGMALHFGFKKRSPPRPEKRAARGKKS